MDEFQFYRALCLMYSFFFIGHESVSLFQFDVCYESSIFVSTLKFRSIQCDAMKFLERLVNSWSINWGIWTFLREKNMEIEIVVCTYVWIDASNILSHICLWRFEVLLSQTTYIHAIFLLPNLVVDDDHDRPVFSDDVSWHLNKKRSFLFEIWKFMTISDLWTFGWNLNKNI